MNQKDSHAYLMRQVKMATAALTQTHGAVFIRVGTRNL